MYSSRKIVQEIARRFLRRRPAAALMICVAWLAASGCLFYQKELPTPPRAERNLPLQLQVPGRLCLQTAEGKPFGVNGPGVREAAADAELRKGTCERFATETHFPLELLLSHPGSELPDSLTEEMNPILSLYGALRNSPFGAPLVRDYQSFRAGEASSQEMAILYVDRHRTHTSPVVFLSLLTLTVIPGFDDRTYEARVVYRSPAGKRSAAEFRSGSMRQWIGWIFFLWGPILTDGIKDEYPNDVLRRAQRAALREAGDLPLEESPLQTDPDFTVHAKVRPESRDKLPQPDGPAFRASYSD